jgi:hypothetical protein
MTITRRAFVLLPALLAAPTAMGQENLVEEMDALPIHWNAAITNFYIHDSQQQPTIPEEGMPQFENPFEDALEAADPDGTETAPTPEQRKALGILYFSLNDIPPRRPPNRETDWLTYLQDLRDDENVSAIVRGRDRNKARLWLHRCFDEGYVAKLPTRERLLMRLSLDVLKEDFEIRKDLQGNLLEQEPQGEDRKEFILDAVRVLTARVELREFKGMGSTGRGGEPGEAVFYERDFTDTTLREINELNVELSLPVGSKLADGGGSWDTAILGTFEADLFVDERLGVGAGEIRKLKAEIRLVAIDKEYAVDLLSGIVSGGESQEPPEQ